MLDRIFLSVSFVIAHALIQTQVRALEVVAKINQEIKEGDEKKDLQS